MNIEAILASIPLVIEAENSIRKQYGFIHKREEVEINGKRGFLICDYILCNEITFQDDKGDMISFGISFSDDETEQLWNELTKKYGIRSINNIK